MPVELTHPGRAGARGARVRRRARRWPSRARSGSASRELHERVAPRRRRADRARASQPGDRVAIWAPNSTDWVVAALGALVRRRDAGPGQHAVHRPRGARRDRPQRRAGPGRGRRPFLGADRLADLRAAGGGPGDGWTGSALGCRATVPDRPRDGRASTGRARWRAAARSAGEADARADAVRPGRRRRHPVHLGHHRAEQGRDERAPADRSASRGPGPSCGGLGAGRPLPGGQPVLPLASATRPGILVCLLTGATLVPQAVFDVGEAMRLIEAERITVLPGRADDLPDRSSTTRTAPTHDLSSLRLAVTGAAACRSR